jgi:predicted SnoaL-like aldol condensation-catalyzing enzyme
MIATLALLGLATTQPTCDSSTAANKALVTQFYTMALVERQPRIAFERYAAPDFVEHKPDVPAGTRANTVAFLEELIASAPAPRWTLLRAVAEGPMVVIHGSFSPAEGAPRYAIADFFRVEKCRIVEHWDVVAPPPKQQNNPNSRF